jgi:hypothetical protein
MKKLGIIISFVFLASSVFAWPRYKKQRDQIRPGYNYVTQTESSNGGKPLVKCNDPGNDRCKGQQPETPPSVITSSWHTFRTAMDLADTYIDAQIASGIHTGVEVKTYGIEQPDGTIETISIEITWLYDANAPFEVETEYEEL